jgi:hypothetical protein
MTAVQIAEYLVAKSQTLEKYAEKIIDLDITGELLMELKEADMDNILDEIGVSSTLDKRRFQAALKELPQFQTGLSSSISSPAIMGPPGGGSRSGTSSCPYLPSNFKYVFFATHTWLEDGLNRKTHDRVVQIVKGLTRRGEFEC